MLETYVVKSVTGFSGFDDVSEEFSADASEEVSEAVVLSAASEASEDAVLSADELGKVTYPDDFAERVDGLFISIMQGAVR